MHSLDDIVSNDRKYSPDFYLKKISPVVRMLTRRSRDIVYALIVYRLMLEDGITNVANVLDKISHYSDVKKCRLISDERNSSLIMLRRIATHAYWSLGLSFSKIGNIIKIDYTTVRQAVNGVNKYIIRYKDLIDFVFSDEEKDYRSLEILVDKYKERNIPDHVISFVFTYKPNKSFDHVKQHYRLYLPEALAIYRELNADSRLTSNGILDTVAAKAGVKVADLKYGGNYSRLACLRYMCSFLLRDKFRKSPVFIAEILGYASEGSVYYGCRIIKKALT